MTRTRDDRPSESAPSMESAPTLAVGGQTRPVAAMPPPTFEPGDLVAGRYRIVRFVASGGMGEVYEAEDRELGDRVALKTMRGETMAESQVAIERLKREINLARRVTHPNVCRIFDVGFHQRDDERITFLTMELLRGETLSHRLRRGGRMQPAEALPIVEQMAAALEAAHRAGVVHRDFKSSNVMLVPAPEAPGGVRVVVTDFGLARGTARMDPAAMGLTGTSGLVGTPSYMAPEQVEGAEASASADIYSLGVVMYEMLTGQTPFRGPNPLAIAVKRLKQPAPSPRRLVPDLDTRWEAVILRCLERQPADRFARVGEVVRTLADRTAVRSHGSHVRPWRGRRRLLVMVALGIVVAAGGAGLIVRSWRGHAGSAGVGRPRPAVAVLGFRNASGAPEAAWLSSALAELLSTELGAGEKLRTIPEENVARMKLELGLGDADQLDREVLERVRQMLAVDFVVVGSYLAGPATGATLRLDLRLQDAVRGNTVASLSERGPQSDLLDLVTRAGAHLREQLGAGGLSPEEVGAARASLPKNPEAARLYAQGLEHMRRSEATAARVALEQAAAIDPRNPLIHSALSAVFRRIGDDAQAVDEAKRALDLSPGLPRVERLGVLAHYREATRDWAGAVEVYRTLWSALPDDIDFAISLARAQVRAGQGREAQATLLAMRRLPPPASEDLRIDWMEAKVAEALSDFRRQQTAAARAAERAAAHGARVLEGDARFLEGNALSELGEKAKATAAYEHAKRLYMEAGHRIGLAQLNLNLGGLDYEAGDLASAKRRIEDALAIERDLGDREETARALNNLAIVESDLGDLTSARNRYEAALAIRREIGDQRGSATSLANIALLEAAQGNLTAARPKMEESIAILRERHQRADVGERLLELGEVLIVAGDFAAARSKIEESLAIRIELGQTALIADSRASLAALSNAEGKYGQALGQAREAERVYEAGHSVDRLARARALLAEALLGQGKAAEALATAERAASLGEKIQNRETRLETAIMLARAQAAHGAAREAMRGLAATIDQARRAGFVTFRLEAELALGEIELGAGRKGAGRARLLEVQKVAQKGGLGLYARRAGAALKL